MDRNSLKKEYTSFAELYTEDFSLTDIFAMRQSWHSGSSFRMEHPRKSSAVIYLNGCAGEYISKDGKSIRAPRGSLVCLPAMSEYVVVNTDAGRGAPDAYLVEFNVWHNGELMTFADSPFVIEGVNSYIAAEICAEAVRAYEAAIRSIPALKAAVYRLLAFLGRETIRSYNKRFRAIEIGIELLEADPPTNMCIEEIAAACGVSSACFRKLFREYSGKSPSEYRMELKLNMAKNMLSGSDISVESVADTLDFDSSAYFCKLFKKKTGMTPTEFRNNQR